MHLILRHPSGRRVDALLLSHDDTLLRVIVHDCNETLELRFEQGYWIDEKGERLSIDAMLAAPLSAPMVLRAGE